METVSPKGEELTDSSDNDEVTFNYTPSKSNPDSLSTPLKTQRNLSTVCRTLFNNSDVESEPDIESDSNSNLNFNSKNEPVPDKEEPPVNLEELLSCHPNLTSSHLHRYNFLSQLHYAMLTETVVLNKKNTLLRLTSAEE